MPGAHGRQRRREGEGTESYAEASEATPARPSSLDRYRRWRQLLDDGAHPSQAALARAEGVSRAAVTLGLRRLQAAERAAGADPAGSPLRPAL